MACIRALPAGWYRGTLNAGIKTQFPAQRGQFMLASFLALSFPSFLLSPFLSLSLSLTLFVSLLHCCSLSLPFSSSVLSYFPLLPTVPPPLFSFVSFFSLQPPVASSCYALLYHHPIFTLASTYNTNPLASA